MFPARVAAILMLLVGFGLAVAAFSAACLPRLHAPRSAAVDVLPLWLGAGLVLQGRDPLDPALAEAQFRAEQLPLRPGGFYSYYPPTASVLALPLRALDFRGAVGVVRWGGALATPLGVALAAAAAFPRRRRPAGVWMAAVGLWLAAGAMLARPARVVLATGQIGPWVVLALGAALFLLARGRSGWAGVVAGGGAALKVAGVVLLPALLWRGGRRGAAAFLVVPVLSVGVLLALGAPLRPVDWLLSVMDFAGRELPPSPQLAGAGVGQLLAARGFLAGGGFLAAGAVLAWRGRGRALNEREAVGLAAAGSTALGLLLAGSAHPHEALVALPGVAYALAWPMAVPRRLALASGGALLAVVLLTPEAFAAEGPRESLNWLPIAALAHVVAVLRVAMGGEEGDRGGWGAAP